MQRRNTLLVAPLALAIVFAMGEAAQAQTQACSAVASSYSHVIYVAGSTAVEPLIAQVGPQLAADATNPTLVVYVNAGSCNGVKDIMNATALTGTKDHYYPASFDPSGSSPAPSCDLGGVMPDVGISDVFGSSCAGVSQSDLDAANLTDYWGPAQAMTFVVPKASTQTAITAEEGYFVFGFDGNTGMADDPWSIDFQVAAASTPTGQPCMGLNSCNRVIRDTGSGTQTMTSLAVGLTPATMLGMNGNGSGGVANTLSGLTGSQAEQTIGILGSDYYDNHRDTLTVLAFQGFGQKAAFYPDSTSTSFDKKNVRDGHYVIWGPVHMLAPSSGTPSTPNADPAKAFIAYVQGKAQNIPTGWPVPANPDTALDAAIAAHVVPACAMKVQRTSELGPLSPSPANTQTCGCYFDKTVLNGSTDCATCAGADGSSCTQSAATGGGTGVCRRGLCEAH